MNKKLAKIGSLIVIITVFIFAVCEVISFHFGSFFICMFLAFGFIMMTAGFAYESESDSKVAAIIAMALSTFFTGLTVKVKDSSDKWLKALLMIHGVFFLGCFFMPIWGIFKPVEAGEMGMGGAIALIIWCIYFLPIGVLAYRHFSKSENN
jgi:hypothetical protein